MSLNKVINLIQLIFITIFVWMLDVIFWGSLLGIIYMLGNWEWSFLFYAKGVATYFVLNAFIMNWTHWFKKVEHEFKT